MSALQTPQKTSRRKELRQTSIVEWYARAVLFWEDQRQAVIGAGVVLLIAALSIPGYLYWQQQRAERANELLGKILPQYEQGNYQAALDGTANAVGLVAIADDYGGTEAGNLAAFYAGNASYQMEDYDRALEFYQDFDKGADFIGASALAAEAAIYENRGEFQTAGETYEEAAAQYDSEVTAPRYLLSAGRAYEEAGDYDAAASAYQQIQDDYPDSQQAGDVDRYLARVEAKRARGAS